MRNPELQAVMCTLAGDPPRYRIQESGRLKMQPDGDLVDWWAYKAMRDAAEALDAKLAELRSTTELAATLKLNTPK